MNPKVLVVGEDKRAQWALRTVLQAEGFEVLLARGAADGLLKAASHPDLDLVLTQEEMHLMDGHQLAQELEKFRPELPLLYDTDVNANDPDGLVDALCFAMVPVAKAA